MHNEVHVRRTGFTLIEVLIALVLGAMILAATSTLVFVYGQVLAEQKLGHPFDDHVDGVVHFLETHLAKVTQKDAVWATLPDGTAARMPCLKLSLPYDTAVFFNEQIRWAIDAYVDLTDTNGLMLYWHCPTADDTLYQNLRQICLSEKFKRAVIHTYDRERAAWKKIECPSLDAIAAFPDILELYFEDGPQTEVRYIMGGSSR